MIRGGTTSRVGGWCGRVIAVTALAALTSGCTLLGWGGNPFGQLGDGTRLGRDLPTPAAQNPDWILVEAGSSSTCGIDTGLALYCWGAGVGGQLGVGEPPYAQTTPARVGTANDWIAVSAGGFGGSLPELDEPLVAPTCGIRAPGDLYCWGRAPGGFADVPQRVGTDRDWTAVSAGAFHACGIRTGRLYCWGANAYGQLGDGSTTDAAAPVRVGVESDWTAVAAASSVHTCGIRAGRLFCWGHNLSGQLGDGTTADSLVPVRVGSESDWVSVTAGGAGEYIWHDPWVQSTFTAHTCGRRANSTLWCWGDNTFGQLGDGSTTNRSAPVEVAGGHGWWSVSAGGAHTCAIRNDRDILCWGVDRNGFLPPGQDTPITEPKVVALDQWVMVSAGGFHTVALRGGDDSF